MADRSPHTGEAPILVVRGLRVAFHGDGGRVEVVDGIDLELKSGETLGIVGESGSGKSVTCLAVLGLLPSPPAEVTADALHFDGLDLLTLSPDARRQLRGNRVAMVFQDPMTSLNPYLRVYKQLAEVLEQHTDLSKSEIRARCIAALRDVGIPDPERRVDAYPHEMSGGMRQRVLVAMALLNQPALLIADEPTTALDVTIQAQILDLFRNLVHDRDTSLVLITHDLGVVAGIADHVAVMYAGQVVERAPVDELFARPSHPYTQGLLQSIPRPDGLGSNAEALFCIPGAPPEPSQPPPGCRFHPRCHRAVARCAEQQPPAVPLSPTHSSQCWFADELWAAGGAP